MASIFSSEDAFYSYYDEASLASGRQALEDLEAYVEREGPFEGVMAFSQGAKLAATLLIRQKQHDPKLARRQPVFRCAIFFSCGVIVDPTALLRDEIRVMDHATDGEVIMVPTAHVWGVDDDVEPRIGVGLCELCNSQVKTTHVHSDGHLVPGPRSREALLGAVQCIRTTIDRARVMQ